MMAKTGSIREPAVVAGLVASGSWIWLRDLSWMSEVENTLPILSGFVLLWWVGCPWVRREPPPTARRTPVLTWVFLLLAGVALDSTTVLAFWWACLFGRWIYRRFEFGAASVAKLCSLAFLSFPWLAADLAAVGWWFRLSGSWATAHVFEWMGFFVQLDGTTVAVEGMPIDVADACSGMNVLQSMLLAGAAIAAFECRSVKGFCVAVLCLPVLAWVANTVRVVLLAVAGLTYGVEFASGWFHTWGSVVVVVTVAALSWPVFRACNAVVLRRRIRQLKGRAKLFLVPGGRPETRSWLMPLAVVVVAASSCGDLVSSWSDDPFNQRGSLAMVIWLSASAAAVLLPPGRSGQGLPFSLPWTALGLVSVVLGTVGALNFLQHLGLALAVASFVPSRLVRLILACLAVAWMPVFGWLGAVLLEDNADVWRPFIALLGLVPALARLVESPLVSPFFPRTRTR